MKTEVKHHTSPWHPEKSSNFDAKLLTSIARAVASSRTLVERAGQLCIDVPGSGLNFAPHDTLNGLVTTLGEATDAICQGNRGATAGFLALANCYVDRLLEDREALETMLSKVANNQLKNFEAEVDSILGNDAIGVSESGPFNQIYYVFQEALETFSLKQENLTLRAVNETAVLANWLSQLMQETLYVRT